MARLTEVQCIQSIWFHSMDRGMRNIIPTRIHRHSPVGISLPKCKLDQLPRNELKNFNTGKRTKCNFTFLKSMASCR